jgi:lipoprotein-releasing system ATP-binding protein
MISSMAHTMAGSMAGSIPAAGRECLVRAERLQKTFHSGSSVISALAGVELSVMRGEMIAITGPSGSGKSTLLHLLGALDSPTSGTIQFEGKLLAAMGENELAELRGRQIGFVWQRHHLLPDFTAAENVAMPLLLRGVPLNQALDDAARWLAETGLEERSENRTGELSGGEQQRVAIARALVGRPALLLADEPTGDLDEKSAVIIFDLMQSLHRSFELTSVIATHNLSMARRADRQFVLEHGALRLADEVFADLPAQTRETRRGVLQGESQVTCV